MLRHVSVGATVQQCARQLPCVSLEASIQPITRTVLRVRLIITPDFRWSDQVSGRQGDPAAAERPAGRQSLPRQQEPITLVKGVLWRSRSTGGWASPGGCGWRTRSTTTSTTPSTSSCRRSRYVEPAPGQLRGRVDTEVAPRPIRW